MFEQSRQGAVDLIHAAVPINKETVGDLSAILDRYVQSSQPRIVLDFGRVSLIDGRGLETLSDYQQKLVARGGCMKLASVNALCLDLLEATGVKSMFEVHETALGAAGSFAK